SGYRRLRGTPGRTRGTTPPPLHERPLPMGDIRALGYLTIDTTELDRWRTLAFDVLDLGEGALSTDDALYLRLDERSYRLVIRRGETDKLTAMGWEVRDEIALDRVRASLREHGVQYRDLSYDEARARAVARPTAPQAPPAQPPQALPGAGLDPPAVSPTFRPGFVSAGSGAALRGYGGAVEAGAVEDLQGLAGGVLEVP